MRAVQHPINVVVLNIDGRASNHGCAGPEQLRAWLAEDRIKATTPVFVEKLSAWMNAETYLVWCDRKTDSEQLTDMDTTLTNLLSVAQELKDIMSLRNGNGRSGNKRLNWEVVGSDGDSGDDDGDKYESIQSSGPRVS